MAATIPRKDSVTQVTVALVVMSAAADLEAQGIAAAATAHPASRQSNIRISSMVLDVLFSLLAAVDSVAGITTS